MCIEDILNAAIVSIFPVMEEREVATSTLEAYGQESFHREIPRVRLAILKMHMEDNKLGLAYWTELACYDFRDILCFAEYPKASKKRGLKDKDPKKYKQLQQQDLEQYQNWLNQWL